MNKRGFTLVEITIVIIIIGILSSLAVVRYMKAVEKTRGQEAETIFEKVRAGYQAELFNSWVPGAWAPGIAAGTDADWRKIGMDNPNASATAWFAYRLENGNEMHAYKRTALGAYSAAFDMTKFLFMNLDTGQESKSVDYR